MEKKICEVVYENKSCSSDEVENIMLIEYSRSKINDLQITDVFFTGKLCQLFGVVAQRNTMPNHFQSELVEI